MTVPYFYRNDNSRFLSVEGKDSSDFLQNLITNDINKCTKENIIGYDKAAESKINEHQKIKTNDGLVLEFIV